MQCTTIKRVKIKIFTNVKLGFFVISAQSYDCGYPLDPPLCMFYIIKKTHKVPVLLYKSGVQCVCMYVCVLSIIPFYNLSASLVRSFL